MPWKLIVPGDVSRETEGREAWMLAVAAAAAVPNFAAVGGRLESGAIMSVCICLRALHILDCHYECVTAKICVAKSCGRGCALGKRLT